MVGFVVGLVFEVIGVIKKDMGDLIKKLIDLLFRIFGGEQFNMISNGKLLFLVMKVYILCFLE